MSALLGLGGNSVPSATVLVLLTILTLLSIPSVIVVMPSDKTACTRPDVLSSTVMIIQL
jgi:hypothetical protein